MWCSDFSRHWHNTKICWRNIFAAFVLFDLSQHLFPAQILTSKKMSNTDAAVPQQPEDAVIQEQQAEQGTDIVELRDLVDIPLARVKRIMKSDNDVKLISQEAVVVVTKAAELLIQHLAKDAFKNTTKENRKTMQYKDLCMTKKFCNSFLLATTVEESDVFDFLSDIIPEKQKYAALLAKATAAQQKK